jgi:PAS domain S-box-containing protein
MHGRSEAAPPALNFLAGGGEMGALLRSRDWVSTPLGAPDTWPRPLKTAVRLILNTGHPMYIWWGPDLLCFYNDAYRRTLGPERHPSSLGERGREVWAEIWHLIGDQVDFVMAGRGSTWDENRPVPITRFGRLDEIYWTYSYSPIDDETAPNGVGGVLVVCTETTQFVLAERRRKAEAERQRRLFEQAPGFIAILSGPEHVFEFVNQSYDRLFDRRGFVGKTVREAFPELRGQGFYELLDGVYATGERFVAGAMPIRLRATPEAEPTDRFLDFIYEPMREEGGAVTGIFVEGYDVTDRVSAQASLHDAEERYLALFNGIEQGFCTIEVAFNERNVPVDYRFLEVSPSFERQTGIENGAGRWMREIAPNQDQHWFDIYGRVARTGEPARFENYSTPLDRWWDVYAFRISGPLRIAVLFRDITDQKRAEAALRESETRFRNMADKAPVMMWVTDPSGFCTYLNARWYEFTGQELSAGEGHGWLDAVHPEDRPLAEQAFISANAGRHDYLVEFRLRRADGVYRWTIDTAAPRFADDGEYLGYIGSVIDIDERREAEERLALSEEKLRLALEVGEIGQWDVDSATQTMFWSSRVKAMFGISPEVPVTLADFYHNIHPDDREKTRAAYEAASDPVRRPLYNVEYRTIGKEDGVVRWVAAKGRGLFDEAGTCTRVIGTAIDVTARKVAERRLFELNESLEQQVEERTADRDRMWRLSTDLMLVARFDASITAVNPAWTSLLGWPEGTLIGRRFIDLVHPEDIAATLAEAGSLAEGRTTLRFENRYQHKDGSYRYLSWTAVPGNNLIHAVARDVTAERERQAELVAAQEQLRQAQKMEAVGQLTGGVAHDFNNLLTIIKSSTDLLRRPDLLEERRRRYVDAISDTVDRASKLTGQLLAFARRQALKPEVFDAAERIQSVADMLRTIVGSRIRIEVDIACEACFVEADASQFETALLNMAVNARDAMDGEGMLTIKVEGLTAMPPIRGHGGSPGRFVALSLSDTGAGIPADKLTQIFEPFYTTKEIGKGTGLGLSQVFGFAKQSGGDVQVTSVVGQGTTFTLYLRRTEPSGAEDDAAAQDGTEPTEHGRGSRVLVVEDNVEVGRFSTQLLQDLGYETTWAANADEALKLIAEVEDFDAVFSDVVMPGLSGIELGHEIRRRYPGLPVVLTSGYSHVLAEEGRHGFELLHKPYAAEELSKVLRRVTRHRSALAHKATGEA